MVDAKLQEIDKRIREDVWNNGDVSLIDDYFADDVTIIVPGAKFRGKDGFKQFMGIYREAFPDLHVTQNGYYQDGNSAALEWTFEGTHNGPLMGIDPTGKKMSLDGVTTSRYDNGKVVEQRFYWDRVEQFTKLGLDLEALQRLKR